MRRRRTAETIRELPPEHLRRFRQDEWYDPAQDPPMPSDWKRADRWIWHAIKAHMRYRDAQRAWAVEHGYDVDAKYGAKPGRDWWAFLKLCEPIGGDADAYVRSRS